MGSADDFLSLDQQLCFALYSASRAMTRAYQPLLEPLGVTYPQYLVLLVLWEEDGVSVKRLGERLALDSGTLTPLLQRLEAQGLVDRRRSDEDERVVHIHLSGAGRQLRAKARGIPKELACQTGFDPSSPRAMEQLGALRDRLRELSATVLRATSEPAAPREKRRKRAP